MTAHICERCKGSCMNYAGTAWRWTCRNCIAKALGVDKPPTSANALEMGPLISPYNNQ